MNVSYTWELPSYILLEFESILRIHALYAQCHGLLTKETGERGCSPARGAGGCTLRDERRPHTEDHSAAPLLVAVLPKHESPCPTAPRPHGHACIK